MRHIAIRSSFRRLVLRVPHPRSSRAPCKTPSRFCTQRKIAARRALPDRWVAIAIAIDKNDGLSWKDDATNKGEGEGVALELCRSVGGSECEVIGSVCRILSGIWLGTGPAKSFMAASISSDEFEEATKDSAVCSGGVDERSKDALGCQRYRDVGAAGIRAAAWHDGVQHRFSSCQWLGRH